MSENASSSAVARGRIDIPTLIAIGLVAYAITNLSHEGLGHGGACVLLGGKAVGLNAVYFDCDEVGFSDAAVKGVAAGGTIVNLVFGAIFAAGLHLAARAELRLRYFLWLLMTLSLLQATGYWLFSGLGNIGDWAKVVKGWEPVFLWRGLLAVAGGVGYYLSVRLALRTLSTMLGGGSARARDARILTLVPYLAGGAMYVIAGLFNPISLLLVLISAAAASFGGASALAWMTPMLRDVKRYPAPDAPPVVLGRSLPWIVAGAVVAGVFIVVLGPTLAL